MVKKQYVLLVLLLATVLGVRLMYASVNEGNYYWDEVVYLHLAENIQHGSYTSSLGEEYRAPLFPFLLSFFGEQHAFLFLFLTVLGSVFAVFLLGRELFTTKIGLIAAIIFSSMPLFFFFSLKLLTEPLTISLIVLSFYFLLRYEKSENPLFLYLMAFASGLSVLARYPAIVLPVVLFSYLFFTRWRKKELYISGFVFLVVLSPLFILSVMHYGHPLGMLLTNLQDQTTPNGTPFFYATHLIFMLGPFIPACFLLGLFSRTKKMPILLFMLAYTLLLSLLSQRTERFFILLFPLFSVIAAKGIARMDKWYYLGMFLLALSVVASIFTSISMVQEDTNNTRFLIETAKNISYPGIVMSNSPAYFVYFNNMTVVNVPKTIENVDNVSYFIIDSYHPRTDEAYQYYERYLNENRTVVSNFTKDSRGIVVYA